MKVAGIHRQSLWYDTHDPRAFYVFDQRELPSALPERRISTYQTSAEAIGDMWVRGAPLIGITAAFGMYVASLQAQEVPDAKGLMEKAHATFLATRPTAVNLPWALDRLAPIWLENSPVTWPARLLQECLNMREEDIAQSRAMGQHGLKLLQECYQKVKRPVQIMTHCNAGWLATIDYGTATAPMYMAQEAGIPIHVWVSETRPRNQGFSITAFELNEAGISHTVLVDNAAGLLMQQGQVDMVLVGSDRTTANGDVANKIGTYLKALAAYANDVPFYVAVPSSSIDFSLHAGASIPIEQRDAEEVTGMSGDTDAGRQRVTLTPAGSPAINYGFDVTPAKYVSGLLTERGICAASAAGLAHLFPDQYTTYAG